MMGRNGKKRRIGSDDDYTLDLERRVVENEKTIAELTRMFKEEMKRKDEKIASLELENAQLREAKSENSGKSEIKAGEDTVVEDVAVTEHDLLIIGDSIVDSIDPQKVNPRGGTTVICIRGGTPNDILEAFRKQSTTKKFKRIVVHVGTNLIPVFSKEYVSDNIIGTMLQIKKLSPNSKLAFSSILPKYNDSWLNDIDYINWRVAMAGFHVPHSRSFGFCNHMCRFVNHNGTVSRSLFRKDGIHLTHSGSQLFTKSLKYLVDMD